MIVREYFCQSGEEADSLLLVGGYLKSKAYISTSFVPSFHLSVTACSQEPFISLFRNVAPRFFRAIFEKIREK